MEKPAARANKPAKASTMDPSSALEQTTHDVSNLQAEFRYILDEIKNADLRVYEQRKKYVQRDAQVQKFVKQHGSGTENPREGELSQKIERELQDCVESQRGKCVLANTALFLVSKHLSKLEKTIRVLEGDNLLAPAEEDKEAESGGDNSRESSVMSGERRRKATPTAAVVAPKRKRRADSTPVPRQKDSTPGGGSDANFDLQDYNDDLFSGYNQAEEDDKQLYCFCQSVSYGEMVACDGPNCKYEWFHYTCVNLKEPPKGAWYCPDCRQELANTRLKKRKA